MYANFFKRFFDILISFCGIIILSPLFLVVAVLIKIDSKGPVLFKQKRLGKYGEPFYILKFRSMCVGAEKKGSGVYSFKNDPRVTRVGGFLRKTSIDELPQLFNIFIGQMSCIGPRPVLTYHPCKFEEYTNEQKVRFEVRPGVTGWAQVNGRKDVDWDTRLVLDKEYVDNLTFWLDIKILFKTVVSVFTNRDNVNTSETVAAIKPKEEKAEAKSST